MLGSDHQAGLLGANMNRCRTILRGVLLGTLAGLSPAGAQATSFQNYHCADETHFIVAFYPHDPSAYLQIDGGSAILRKRVALSGTRYSGAGVTLKYSKTGAISVKRARRPETACEPG
jgi:membrane-bound inhibitor of C-type lysozyme